MSVAVAVAPGAHSATVPPEATITRDGDFAGPLAPARPNHARGLLTSMWLDIASPRLNR
jgi:hypothetical protein